VTGCGYLWTDLFGLNILAGAFYTNRGGVCPLMESDKEVLVCEWGPKPNANTQLHLKQVKFVFPIKSNKMASDCILLFPLHTMAVPSDWQKWRSLGFLTLERITCPAVVCWGRVGARRVTAEPKFLSFKFTTKSFEFFLSRWACLISFIFQTFSNTCFCTNWLLA